MAPSPCINSFCVGISADFLSEQGALVFPDIGLSLLDGVPGITYEFLPEYRAEYAPEQLRDYDVLISLKPRVTVDSLNAPRGCAPLDGAGWAMTTWIWWLARNGI